MVDEEDYGGRESGWKRVPRGRKRGRERKTDPCWNHGKNKILLPIHGSVSLLFVISSSALRLTARFSHVPSGQTLFLDIHPQKCNDRLLPAVKLSTDRNHWRRISSMIPFVQVTGKRKRERENLFR